MSSKSLLKVLAAPAKVASSLDWRKLNGSVLSLNIHKDRIGVAIASHPSFGEQPTTLPDIPLAGKGRVTTEIKERLAALAKDRRVCGMVVAWPIQRDTGRLGAPCGRVLHTLEQLVQDSNLCTASRPLCLWDGNHSVPAYEDNWGRSPAYSQTSDKKEHRASLEQYNQDETVVAAKVWDDFCRSHWPELYQPKQALKVEPTPTRHSRTAASVDDSNWEETSSYVNAALL